MKIVLECLAKTDLKVANANRDASENIRKLPSTERVWNQKTAEGFFFFFCLFLVVEILIF